MKYQVKPERHEDHLPPASLWCWFTRPITKDQKGHEGKKNLNVANVAGFWVGLSFDGWEGHFENAATIATL